MQLRQRVGRVNYADQLKVDLTSTTSEEEEEEEEEEDSENQSSLIQSMNLLDQFIPCSTTDSQLKPALYHKVNQYDDIHAYLSSRVKNQNALYNLALTMGTVLRKNESSWGPDKPLLYKWIFCGTSGCGKTETVLALKHYFGMEDGYENEGQFVSIDGSTMTDETQINCLTGAAAGLIGYKDGGSLPDRLNLAIKKPPAPAPNTKRKKTQQSSASVPAVAPYKPPRYIMLFIDEVDKVCLDFLKAINGLLETGNYNSPSGISFILPKETVMMIVCTANYGAEAISAMELPFDEDAEKLIVQDMREHGLQPWTIVRLGDIFPYYPLSPEALRDLLLSKLEDHIERSELGKRHKIYCTEELKKILVEHVLKKVDEDHGIRGGIKQIFQKLDLLFEKALAVLNKMVEEGFVLRAGERLEMTGHSFNINEFENSVKNEWDPIIHSIRTDPANQQCLALTQKNQEQGGILTAMGMRVRNRELCHLAMNVYLTVNNHYHQHIHQHSSADDSAKIKRLTNENRDLKLKLGEVDTLAQAATPTNLNRTLIEIKRLTEGMAADAAALLESGEEMEEDPQPRVKELTFEEAEQEEAKSKKRKRSDMGEEEEKEKAEEETRSSPKRLKHNEEDEFYESGDSDSASELQHKGGRQRKEIEGFEWAEYRNNHTFYKCLQCSIVLDRRAISKHHC